MKMNMNIKLLRLLVAPSLLLACTSINDDMLIENDINDFQIETKTQSIDNDKYFVSSDDLEKYFYYLKLSYANDKKEYVLNSVSPVKNCEGQVLAYEILSNQGWEIISADKRADTKLAFSDNLEISIDSQSEAAKNWIEYSLRDIEYLMAKPDFLGEGEEEIERINSNYSFWQMVTGDPDFILPSTKSHGDPIPIDGYWQLVSTDYDHVFYDKTEHLITTNWYSSIPYNDFCPYHPNMMSRINASSDQIAGGQYLFYMHYKIGVPVNAPSSGYVEWSPDSLSYHLQSFFSDYDSEIWDQMSLYPEKAAYLIGDLGKKINQHYYTDDGWGSPNRIISHFSALVNSAFPFYGLSGDIVDYNRSDIFDSLNSEIPVIVCAASDRTAIFHRPENYYTFLIDAYYREQLRVTNTYEWIWSDPEGEQSIVFPRQEVTYSLPDYKYFGFNLGDGQDNDDIWYSTFSPWSFRNETFQYDIKMMANVNMQ